MLRYLERPRQGLASWRGVFADLRPIHLANGFIGWIFAATAPVAIVLSVGAAGGLSPAQLNSTIFAIFFFSGATTILLSLSFRQPLAFFWSIPGSILVGPTLARLGFPAVVGAYLATGLGLMALGASGGVRRAMTALPMPIVMGMISGVFLRFGTDLVRALKLDLAVAGPMVAVWFALSAAPSLGRRLPPTLAALVLGAGAAIALGRIEFAAFGAFELSHPIAQAPAFSGAAMLELVAPLAVTALAVQNAQGISVLRAAGHDPPINALTVACGLCACVCGVFGGVTTTLGGPTNALLASGGDRDRQYAGAAAIGALSMAFALLAPPFARFMLQAPKAFLAALAGLAMLRVLQNAFHAAFRDRFALGALISLLVTVADIPLFNIGAPFWALIAGFLVSLATEREDFRN